MRTGLRHLRAVTRLLRLLLVAWIYTSYVALAAQFVPKADRSRFRSRYQARGSATVCRIFGIRVRATSSPASDIPLLIVCNHFGVLDPFALASVLQVAFVGKAEIRQWPVFGWIAKVHGVIFVYRDRHHTVADFVEAVRSRMRERVPVLVFPEGTTSGDATIKPFKTGAFAAVAGMKGAAILPVYLKPLRVDGVAVDETNRHTVTWADGTESFMANVVGILQHRGIEMEVRVGDHFLVGDSNRKALAEEAHRRVAALRDGIGVTDTFRNKRVPPAV